MSESVPRLRPSLRSSAPRTDIERTHWEQGASVVVGFDEVGKGAWAGPLTVGAVVIPHRSRIYKVRDSKQLRESEREALVDRITDWADRWAVGHASAAECDDLGMSDAQRLATVRAIDRLGVEPDHSLVDGNWDFVERGSTTRLVKGDQRSLSIAAASIIAKVTRDRMMRASADEYPWYGFESNKGYPSPDHRAALRALGPSGIHRRSWAFMRSVPWSGIAGCEEHLEDPTLF
ncbi:MAG: ribonuclease HII [Acidimicrobiia bacterium]|nr:ribonuclease HII [Acidimicrobiia bacterium]